MDECTYSPQISPGNSNRTPIPDVQPTLTPINYVELAYPFSSPTTTLQLRRPEFNDKLVPKISRILRYSRGNTLRVYRDPVWLKQTIINWNFSGLTKVEAEAALDFFLESVGKEIKLTDYNSQVYKGVILNPENPISQESKSACSYTLKLDFQGTLQ